jgi:hypothetical protein
MNEYSIKENGRKFKVIKYMSHVSDQWIKPEYLDQINDVFIELNNGWFENKRTGVKRNIMNFDDRCNYFKELRE